MTALVVYESIYGNTRAIAEAIAEGLGGAAVATVQQAPQDLGDCDLLVVGSPTHVHSMPTTRSRQFPRVAARPCRSASPSSSRHKPCCSPRDR